MKNPEKIKLLKNVREKVEAFLPSCRLCPRNCGVNRLVGERGSCGVGLEAPVYTAMPHQGEEPPLSASNGSGTIFFSGCGMKCVYCQNHQFSQSLAGKELSAEGLGKIMLKLESMGCHNINLVNPTYSLPVILEALEYSVSMGLNVPVVYNTGGYDSVETIRAISGVIDIYLPDMRYSSDIMAERYSGIKHYVKTNRDVIKEMYRQVGDLESVSGVAVRGLIVRLLVLPEKVSGTEETLEFISGELGNDVAISLMSQYSPVFKSGLFPEIDRKITREEYESAVNKCESLGFHNGWIQPFGQDFDENLLGENFEKGLKI